MPDIIVSQDIDNFMQSSNATNALRLLSGFPISGGTVVGNVALTGSLSALSLSATSMYVSGNTITNNLSTRSLTATGNIYASKFITLSGTASQVVKGDGSLLTLGAGVSAALSIGAGVSGGFVRTGDTIANALSVSNPLRGLLGIQSINFYDRTLHNVNGVASVNYGIFTLTDASLIPSVLWGARSLCESVNGSLTVDWDRGNLLWNELITVDWQAYTLYGAEGGYSVFWGSRQLADNIGYPTLNWNSRELTFQWTTSITGKTSGNLMSMATYTSTTTSGTYNPPLAPANAGMVIYHQSTSSALISSMTLQLYGVTSAIDSVPVGGDISFTSRYGITALSGAYGSYTFLGTPVTTIAAGNTITWRKVASNVIARLT